MRPRELLVGGAIAMLLAAFGMVSLGFATAAAWLHLDGLAGPLVACLAMAGAYALAALVMALVLHRWRRSARRPAALPAGNAQVEAILRGLGASGGGQDATAFATAVGGREMAPLERLAVALVSGFLAGRNLGR